MKIQDILFVLVFLGVLGLRKPKIAVITGLACFLLAMPLFHFWIFFTAERLTWYGAGFVLLAIMFFLINYNCRPEC